MVAVPSADQDQPRTDQPDSPHVLASVTLLHKWIDRSPRWLFGKHLRVCYRLLSDGAVVRQLVGVDTPGGDPIAAARRTFPSLNWAEEQERGGREGKGRPVVLKVSDPADAEGALMTWLESVELLGDDDG